MSAFLTIAIVHFLGTVSPGQDFIGITRFTLKNGIKKANRYAAGIASGQAIYIVLSIFGLMQILFKIDFINKAFLFLSGLYLLYLGFIIIKAKKVNIKNKEEEKRNIKPFRSGFMITISNPKAPIFYASILANFIDKSSTYTFLILLTIYLILATFIIFYGVALMFNLFREKITRYTYCIEKLFALCLWYFGIKLISQLY